MRRLPIGISSLEKIVADDCVYVDKTQHIYNLANSGGSSYFLSRPRRFGKSLLIDTIKQAFLGNAELFKGLYLEKNWDWTAKYPVLHFDFGEGSTHSPEALNDKINSFLDKYYQMYQIDNAYQEAGTRFAYLIEQLVLKHNKVVVLIDEYDKPILDNIDNSELARSMREFLRGFYSVIKAQDRNLKFVMLTGVSKFSKVSIFSGLNNLDDITLDSRYADICGYTQTELEESFAAYLEAGKVDRALLKKWYNGYNFKGSAVQKVYNPFDILFFFSKGYEYQSYWFETGTPTFLVKLIEKHNYFIPECEDLIVGESALATFDVDNMPIATLLMQTGYLTIKKVISRGSRIAYILTYPNYEVKSSLNDCLAAIGSDTDQKERVLGNLFEAVENDEFTQVKQIFTSHFASIPHDWYRKNNINNYEGFYASVVYSYFTALGYDLIAEDVTNQGNIDLTIIMPDKILILEFKLIKYGDAESAIKQILDKKYPEKYLSENKKIYLLGMSFDPEKRNVLEVKTQEFTGSEN